MFLTFDESLQYLEVKTETLMSLIERGEIKAIRIKNELYIEKYDLDSYQSKQTV